MTVCVLSYTEQYKHEHARHAQPRRNDMSTTQHHVSCRRNRFRTAHKCAQTSFPRIQQYLYLEKLTSRPAQLPPQRRRQVPTTSRYRPATTCPATATRPHPQSQHQQAFRACGNNTPVGMRAYSLAVPTTHHSARSIHHRHQHAEAPWIQLDKASR